MSNIVASRALQLLLQRANEEKTTITWTTHNAKITVKDEQIQKARKKCSFDAKIALPVNSLKHFNM